MFVKDILRDKGHDVFTIESHVTLMEVVDELVDRGCGALVVIEDGQLAGIVTERDILKASSISQRPLSETALENVMKRDLVTVAPTDRIGELMTLMTSRRIRHLPVVDGEELIGIVSIGDVVKAQDAELRAENRFLKEYISG